MTALFKQFLRIFVNPMFQGPDEVQHLAMVSMLDKYGPAFYANNNSGRAYLWDTFEQSLDFSRDFYQQPGTLAQKEKQHKFSSEGQWGIDELSLLHADSFDSSDKNEHVRLHCGRHCPQCAHHYRRPAGTQAVDGELDLKFLF